MERKTPLYDRHTAAGGKLVPFAGWLLPVQYSGVIAEHRAVRTGCGLYTEKEQLRQAAEKTATWESCSSGAPTPWPTSTGS